MNNPEQISEENTNFKEILDLVWQEKLKVLFITSIFSIFFILYSLSIENTYISESILKVNSDNNSSLSQYSGIASMAGIDLGGGGGKNSIDDLETVLMSRSFVNHLTSFDDIVLNIMAAKSFNTDTQEIILDEDDYSLTLDKWVREVDFPFESLPASIEVHEEYVNRLVSIRVDDRAQFIILSVEHVSPIFAKEFLDLIIREINSIMRQRDLTYSSNAMKYLKEQLANTPQVEIRNAINDLVKSELRTQMTTKINEDYVLTKLEDPFIPLQKSNPKRSIIVILGSILGFLFGVSSVLLINLQNRKSK
jgi:LPS O-antigen subunit length determinant protein (WzzB/FepE family)